MKILVCDSVHREGIEKLEEAGFEVDVNATISHEQLRKGVSEYYALIVRGMHASGSKGNALPSLLALS